MRAFLALNIEEPIIKELAGIQQELQNIIKEVKWVNPELLHITIKFWGEIYNIDIHNLENSLRELAAKTAPFRLSFSGLGAFPDQRRPRVIWLGIDKGNTEVSNISIEVEKVFSSTKEISYDDKELFLPHITLGRKKKNQNIVLKEDVFHMQWICHREMHVDSMYLMESTLRPTGPLYKPLKKFLFKSSN